MQPPHEAPMRREGANKPPAPPDPTVTLVATSFTSARSIKPEMNGIAVCKSPVSALEKYVAGSKRCLMFG